MLAPSQASFRVPSEFAGFPKAPSISLRPFGVSIALSFLQSHIVERFPASITVGHAVIPGPTKFPLPLSADPAISRHSPAANVRRRVVCELLLWGGHRQS